MLSEKTVVDVFPFRIQIIQNNIGIATMTCCENDDFEVFTQILKNLESMRSYIDTRLNNLSSREGNWKLHIIWRRKHIITMNQRLI